jgi:hypothetical protein
MPTDKVRNLLLFGIMILLLIIALKPVMIPDLSAATAQAWKRYIPALGDKKGAIFYDPETGDYLFYNVSTNTIQRLGNVSTARSVQ